MITSKPSSPKKTKSWLQNIRSRSIRPRTKALPKRSSTEVLNFEDGIVTMGKSNKFDYTNRPNSGTKLGQLIGGALQKEADKVKKDAERHLQKARKQSNGSSSGQAEITGTTHTIDLKVPSKDLGDDGVCALLDGLEIALRSGTSEASLALEDLNFSGNGITTLSLARLAPIIRLARYDLKTLDLSKNKIRVENDEEAAQWESFLLAFKDCMKLRRLDLSGNTTLGRRAWEIFARVHSAEDYIAPIPAGGESSTLSLLSERRSSVDNVGSSRREESDGLGIDVDFNMTRARLIRRRSGLRSIPYITLHDVGLDDAGALWLSYVLEDHFYPNQLINELNATDLDSSIKTYQQDADFRGVDWDDNTSLSKESIHLLQRTENIRRQALLDDDDTLASFDDDGTNRVQKSFEDGRRRSIDSGYGKMKQDRRRASIRSIHTADGGEHEATELESARKRFKRAIIVREGTSSVELWSSALKLLKVSRLLLFISPLVRKCYIGPLQFELTADSPARNPSPELHPHMAPTGLSKQRVDHDANIRRTSYAATLAIPTHPTDNALTDVTNTPITPLILQKPTHRKGAFSEGDDFQSLTGKLNVILLRSQDPKRFVKYQQARLVRADQEERLYRDMSVPSHLPVDVMLRIAGFLLAEKEVRVMNEEQKRTALSWGQRREALLTEREWLKKDDSAQILMLLDSIGCLAYRQ